MKISVCCPSYKRPKVETLEYLPFIKIYVDHKEAEEYKHENPEADIVECPEGVQGNVARIRNWILDREFEGGADVCCLVDDDMKCIKSFEVEDGFGYNEKMLETDEFMIFLEKYSLLCAEWGYYLWGINSNSDPMVYLHYTPFSTLSFIGGPFSVHLKNAIRYDERFRLKEDYDIFIEHCRQNRGVLRVNKYHYYVKQATNIGGCASYRTNNEEEKQFRLLQKKWGDDIVKSDKISKRGFDFNPIIHIPIKGI